MCADLTELEPPLATRRGGCPSFIMESSSLQVLKLLDRVKIESYAHQERSQPSRLQILCFGSERLSLRQRDTQTDGTPVVVS
jgi:hypothetical protein